MRMLRYRLAPSPAGLRLALCLATAVAALTACMKPLPAEPNLAADPTNLPAPTPTHETLVPGLTSPPEVPDPSPSPLPAKIEALPASEETALPLPEYTLTAELNYGRHHLAVEERIEYANRSGEPLEDLLLLVEPTRYPGVFRLISLSWGSGEAVTDYALDLGQLHIPLAQPLAPGASLTLDISYELNLPSPDANYYGRPIPFGYTARQTNLVDWYPYLPPYIPGQGWLSHQAGFFGEHLAYESANFRVNVRIEDDRPELTVAASAPAERDGDWRRYRLEAARNFAWSVSHLYTVTTTTVDGVQVSGYAFPAHAAAGEATLQVTAEALALYSRLFAPYPHRTLSVVEADFLDGMEFDGLYFLSNAFYNLYRGEPADYLTAIAAHETAHQWWYGLVGNDQALEPWLDEALATYSERLYYENLHPEALDWWWAYRVQYYNPHGWVDGSIYNPEGYRAYRDAVYLNGVLFLEELRGQIGEQAFLTVLREYSAQNRGRVATGNDFFSLLEPYAGEELSGLIARYFSRRAGGAP